jgi:hypothetical protein
MLRIPELYIHVDRESPPGGFASPSKQALNVAEFNIVKSADGRTNIFALEKRLRKKKKPGSDTDRDSDIEFRGHRRTQDHAWHRALHRPYFRNRRRARNSALPSRDEVVTTIKNEKDLEDMGPPPLLLAHCHPASPRKVPGKARQSPRHFTPEAVTRGEPAEIFNLQLAIFIAPSPKCPNP